MDCWIYNNSRANEISIWFAKTLEERVKKEGKKGQNIKCLTSIFYLFLVMLELQYIS